MFAIVPAHNEAPTVDGEPLIIESDRKDGQMMLARQALRDQLTSAVATEHAMQK